MVRIDFVYCHCVVHPSVCLIVCPLHQSVCLFIFCICSVMPSIMFLKIIVKRWNRTTEDLDDVVKSEEEIERLRAGCMSCT